jgi:hypothetical protein
MLDPKPLVTPFPEFRYTNSHTRSTVLVDLDLTITILLELKGIENTLHLNLFTFLRDPTIHGISALPLEAIQPSDSTSQGILAK